MITERQILLRRFFWKDRDLYELGKLLGIEWFEQFAPKFARDKYAYFANEEKREAIARIVNSKNDDEFVSALNRVGLPDYMEIDRFLGHCYSFDRESGFQVADKRDQLRKEVMNSVTETKGRAYYFLKAIIELHKEGKWDKAYGGATWPDVLAKIREIGGSYPSPRDLVILKSYKLYYRTGSRRYPTHTVPEETLHTVGEVLDSFGKLRGDRNG